MNFRKFGIIQEDIVRAKHYQEFSLIQEDGVVQGSNPDQVLHVKLELRTLNSPICMKINFE